MVMDDARLQSVRHVLRTATGRGKFLAIAGASEASGSFFDDLAVLVEPAHVLTVRRHQQDEDRHAWLLRAAARRNGVHDISVAGRFRLWDSLAQASGGFMSRLATAKDGVMRAYCLLQVAEERAADQYRLLAPVFDEMGDPDSADMLRGLATDEVRHLGWCAKLSTYYAPSIALRDQTLDEYRELEDRIFGDFAVAVFMELAQ